MFRRYLLFPSISAAATYPLQPTYETLANSWTTRCQWLHTSAIPVGLPMLNYVAWRVQLGSAVAIPPGHVCRYVFPSCHCHLCGVILCKRPIEIITNSGYYSAVCNPTGSLCSWTGSRNTRQKWSFNTPQHYEAHNMTSSARLAVFSIFPHTYKLEVFSICSCIYKLVVFSIFPHICKFASRLDCATCRSRLA